MEMTIDEAIRRIEHHNYIHQRREPRAIYISEAFKIAIDTMRKYQQIEQIHKDWFKEFDSAEAYTKISEVIRR